LFVIFTVELHSATFTGLGLGQDWNYRLVIMGVGKEGKGGGTHPWIFKHGTSNVFLN